MKTQAVILTKSQLASRLGVSEKTISRMTRAGRVPAAQLGHRTVRYHWPTVAAHLFPLLPEDRAR